MGQKETLKGKKAITYARKILSEGKIAAIKGIGGFHLACDAKDERAIRRLRELKSRPMKPFAVMCKDIETILRECELSDAQKKVLTGHQKPIVIAKKKLNSDLSSLIAPDNPNVGVMLPYAPLHLLMFEYPDGYDVSDCLVMTSGNAHGAPICKNDEDAIKEISSFCDAILSHDRNILIRADDTVMDFFEDRPYMIRRSRGYAPLPVISSKAHDKAVLAVGGELKNTFCLAKKDLYYPSSYVGDLSDIRTVRALEESIYRMEDLLEINPDLIVCDMHPKYESSNLAEELSKKRGIPLVKIQHHYAHILSCMAENDFHDKVIGFSFDGTGFGDDGSVWGGEVFVCNEKSYERAGAIDPFWHIGGDIASREGWRIAASMLCGIMMDKDKAIETSERLKITDSMQQNAIFTQYQKKQNAVTSTSVGRLFDAVSTILGYAHLSTFEGEAANALMFGALDYEKKMMQKGKDKELWKILKEDLSFLPPVPSSSFIFLPTKELVRFIANEKTGGRSMGYLSLLFHAALGRYIGEAAEILRKEHKIKTVALSGGVFQNKLLLKNAKEELIKRDFNIITHSLIPPNDGGLALGQAVYGMGL